MTVTYGEKSFSIPITIIDSQKPGQVYVFTGGIHGDEPGGSKVVEKIAEYFKSARLKKGKIILLPKINPLGLEKKTRRFPDSDEDLNRCFTDTPKTVGEKIIAQLIEKIKSFTPDQIIDIHNDWKSSLPYTILDSRNFLDEKLFQKNLNISKTINFPIIEEKHILEVSLSGYFSKHGIPALTLEIGGDKEIYKKFINLGKYTLLYLLYQEGMIKFNFWTWLKKFSSPAIVSGKTLSYVDVPTPIPKSEIKKVVYYAKPKALVNKGTLLCIVYDKKGIKEKILSPINGIVLAHNEKIPEYPEEELYALGNLE